MRSSLIKREETFLTAATIASHANYAGPLEKSGGFRQRDVHFLIDLFINWAEYYESQAYKTVQNVQVSRYLEKLCADGYARRLTRGKAPLYRLTRTGLLELTERLVNKSFADRPLAFLFTFYFISGYKKKIWNLVELEGVQFPTVLKLELEPLLNEASLLEAEKKRINKEMERLKARIDGAREASKLARRGRVRGAGIAEITREIERSYPYELNSQKPLSELILGIPESSRLWELEQGNNLRSELIFEPKLKLLAAYLSILSGLTLVKEKSGS